MNKEYIQDKIDDFQMFLSNIKKEDDMFRSKGLRSLTAEEFVERQLKMYEQILTTFE